MAQDFTRYSSSAVGTSAVQIAPGSGTANSNDVIIGISLSNITGSTILADCYINNGSANIHLVKSAPIPSGGSLQVLAGGAKAVMQNGDALSVKSDTASSLDVWVSTVDSVS
tara:strand:- start:28 stop:363 length:336 start_codon:yes stop_codon:yes gene_type:complete